jgi:hypothetical protein
MTTRPALFVSVGTSADEVITLSPRRLYEIENKGANAVYGSTDGTAVDADDSSALGKIKLEARTAATVATWLTGVRTLKLKAVSAACLVQITVGG